MKSAFDGRHVKSVSVVVLMHPNYPTKVAGRIVANWSDNPAGSVCTMTLHVHSGPLSFLPTCTGTAGGYGYDKLSAAIQSGIGRAKKKRDEYTRPEDHEKVVALEVDHFAGAGMSAVSRWFEKFGYKVDQIV